MQRTRVALAALAILLTIGVGLDGLFDEPSAARSTTAPGTSLQIEELAAAQASGDAAAIEYVVTLAQRAAWIDAVLANRAQAAAAEAAYAASLWARWGPVNQCEQGGDWHAYGTFGNGLRGGGGLGISDGAWQENGGTEYGPNAAAATPEQQMIVAERIYDRYGASAWGCPVPG